MQLIILIPFLFVRNSLLIAHNNLLNKSISDLKTNLEDLTTVTEIHPGEKGVN